MPKHDFFSPKAISNRIKSKGLQKLRWYCEMCQKQCRDENGFKCHQTSEGHLRQMRIFAEDPSKVMSTYSQEFEETFVDNLSRRHGTKRVHANVVYQEYIADKNHVHMNATKWETLSNFCKYLGKAGICTVDETEKGWYMAYIDRDPAALARQAALEKKRKHAMDDEERARKELRRRVKAGGGGGGANDDDDDDDGDTGGLLKRGAPGERIQVQVAGSLFAKTTTTAPSAAAAPPPAALEKKPRLFQEAAFPEDDDVSEAAREKKKRPRNLDAIMESDLALKAKTTAEEEAMFRSESWIHEGIVVKVMTKVADSAFYKKKATVRRVVDDFVAEVRVNDDAATILQLDQDDLETVIPATGKRVLVLNGRGRGAIATVQAVDVDDFSVKIMLESGTHAGTVLDKIQYEDVSKIASS